MTGLLYTITLREPVLANGLGGEPNSAQSLFYIPGGLVRGALINTYTGSKDAGDEDFRRLFLDGRTRYLNAYPSADGKRSLPTPTTWQTPRHPRNEDKTLYNIAEANAADDELKSASFDFWFPGGDTVHGLEEEWQINIHTQRDAQKGRSTTEAGAVFRYIALPAGMKLQGAILLSPDKTADDVNTIKRLLDGKTILLGKARTAGYGHAFIEVEEAELSESWRETEMPFEPASIITQFTLTMLSPALVRDDNGQFSLDITTALRARLGNGLTIKAYRKPEIVGGFNRTWGLPLPQVTAIAAGSVFVVSGNVDADKLKRLEETGIGERRAEGFGRVMVEFIQPERMNWVEARAPIVNLNASKNSLADDDRLAKMMLKRLLRRDLDQAILNVAREAVGDKKNGIANSQLSRWRVILRDSLSRKVESDPIQRMMDFHKAESKKHSSAWTKMERTRIQIGKQQPRLTEWIDLMLTNSDPLIQALGNEVTRERMLGKVPFNMDEELKVEYRLRLMDAVLARMEKVNSKKAEAQNE